MSGWTIFAVSFCVAFIVASDRFKSLAAGLLKSMR
jgi:hypothetical protein